MTTGDCGGRGEWTSIRICSRRNTDFYLEHKVACQGSNISNQPFTCREEIKRNTHYPVGISLSDERNRG